MKEEVKRDLLADAVNPSKQLNIIDGIQRLGVAYHFEKEIEEALQHVYEARQDYEINNNFDDLYNVSLQFRLLRQEGYNVSCGKPQLHMQKKSFTSIERGKKKKLQSHFELFLALTSHN